mgnify:CR=1 FL=1
MSNNSGLINEFETPPGNTGTINNDYKCDIFSLGFTLYYLMTEGLPKQTKTINSKVVSSDNPTKKK